VTIETYGKVHEIEYGACTTEVMIKSPKYVGNHLAAKYRQQKPNATNN
jgi:hypothetical protein